MHFKRYDIIYHIAYRLITFVFKYSAKNIKFLRKYNYIFIKYRKLCYNIRHIVVCCIKRQRTFKNNILISIHSGKKQLFLIVELSRFVRYTFQ